MYDFILEITCDAAVRELVEARLFLTASTGSTTSGEVIAAYFDSPDDRAAAMESLREIEGIAMHAFDRERVDWLALYQQSLEPMFIGERFVVAPDASLLADAGARLTLVVPQEQAFGTGSHETTSLCIELLESLVEPGMRGLDIGSGSGILALAMLRLGASKAIAFDNDPDAYGALRDNRIRNGVDASRMPLFIGGTGALRGGTFDLVTMNIIPEVIIPLLGDVVRHVGDALVLSGILVVRRDDVVSAAREHELELVQERSKGEWWAGVFRP
ncbi:MAG TPA: 50S ribosomal protein L11 methyltransferase [Thermoanaerobaculia bacterium]|jgi:ribosomal protein L11 methyltransferase